MFISVLIPSDFEERPARHLLVFYKQLHAMGRSDVAFVGEQAYFGAPAELQASGRPEWAPGWRATFEYEPPANLDDVAYEPLPPDLLTARLRRLHSPWTLYGHLVTRRLPEIEAAWASAVDRLRGRRRPEAILTFANLPSLEHVARMRGIPVVHTHFGPLRAPAYAMTGYWDLRGVNSRTDVVRRFRAFRRELAGTPLPLLTGAEILSTLRRLAMPPAAGGPDARFGIGVALQGEENAYVHGLSGLDVLSLARRYSPASQIAVRYHPGAVSRYAASFGVTDTSGSSTEFIQACDTILTVNSGVAFEALLMGRRCVVLGDSPFRIAADRSLDASGARPPRDLLLALNFLAFGYLVPYALMFDPEYSRWRLGNPPEIEIVRRHKRWYEANTAPSVADGRASGTLLLAAARLEPLGADGEREPLIVFGAGASTRSVVRLLKARFDIRRIFDNDPRKRGTYVDGIPVENPGFHPRIRVAIASLTHADSMAEELRRFGYRSDHILRLM